MQSPPPLTGWSTTPSAFTGCPSRRRTCIPQPAGHSVHVVKSQVDCPGMTPSSGGISAEISGLRPFSELHAEKAVLPVRRPSMFRKVRRSMISASSDVTGGAVGRRPPGQVAGQAPAHVQRADPLHPRHLRDAAVADGAVDARLHVPLVREVHEGRERVHALPDHRLLAGDVPAELLHLGTIQRDGLVAGHARGERRDRRAGGARRVGVAEETLQPELPGVDGVGEGDRLRGGERRLAAVPGEGHEEDEREREVAAEGEPREPSHDRAVPQLHGLAWSSRYSATASISVSLTAGFGITGYFGSFFTGLRMKALSALGSERYFGTTLLRGGPTTFASKRWQRWQTRSNTALPAASLPAGAAATTTGASGAATLTTPASVASSSAFSLAR